MAETDERTADQIAWVEIAQAIRAQVLKYAANIPAMNPQEVMNFVDTARQALWLEQDAATFDREVELKNNRITHGD